MIGSTGFKCPACAADVEAVDELKTSAYWRIQAIKTTLQTSN